MIKILMLLIIAALPACGSAPAPRIPQALEQAQTADKNARLAMRNGDLLRAQQAFAKTLLLQRSLDDVAGAATTIINLATVTHQLHDDEGALDWLDKILLEQPGIYPQGSYLDASFRKAVILANLGRIPEAEVSLEEAGKLCEKKCSLRFGVDGLSARLLLLKGDATGAFALARVVSKDADAEKEEQANALRVMAEAEEKLARYADALQHYQAALDVDRVLSLSSRIGEDLSGLARVAKQLGREQDANYYLHRADWVNDSIQQNKILSTPIIH